MQYANCDIEAAKRVIAIAKQVQVSRNILIAYRQVPSVEVIEIHLCPALRAKVVALLERSNKVKAVAQVLAANNRVNIGGYVVGATVQGGRVIVYTI